MKKYTGKVFDEKHLIKLIKVRKTRDGGGCYARVDGVVYIPFAKTAKEAREILVDYLTKT